MAGVSVPEMIELGMQKTYDIPVGMDLFTQVSERDVERVLKHRWDVIRQPRSHTCYAATLVTEPETGKRKIITLHKFLMGSKPGMVIDHRDRNGLNNTRSNLRWATPQQNAVNREACLGNATGFKGVSALPSGKFKASITRHGATTHLGVYDAAEDAAFVYNLSAAEHDKQFACPNRVDRRDEVDRFLGKVPNLTHQQRVVLLARFGESLQFNEIAARIGEGRGDVIRHYGKGMKAVRVHYGVKRPELVSG